MPHEPLDFHASCNSPGCQSQDSPTDAVPAADSPVPAVAYSSDPVWMARDRLKDDCEP